MGQTHGRTGNDRGHDGGNQLIEEGTKRDDQQGEQGYNEREETSGQETEGAEEDKRNRKEEVTRQVGMEKQAPQGE